MKYIALDIETTGLDYDKHRILGIGLYAPDIISKYYSFRVETEERECREIIQRFVGEGYKFIAQNAQFDWQFCKYNGINWEIGFDPKIAAPLLADRPSKNSLEDLAYYYLNAVPWKDTVDTEDMANESDSDLAEYCLRDCRLTYELFTVLCNKLEVEGQQAFYFTKLLPLYKLLAATSYTGMALDQNLVESLKQDFTAKVSAKYSAFREYHKDVVFPFEQLMLDKALSKYKTDKSKAKVAANPPTINLGSPDQVLELLTGFCDVQPRDRDGKLSTSDDALSTVFQHPIVKDILDYRELVKPIEFFTKWQELVKPDGRIHSTFNADRARTGRLSSSNPNLQQVPTRSFPEIRNCFVAEEGKLLVVRDLSQIEPRFVAHYSQDPALMQVYKENLSIYGQVAVKLGFWKGHPNELKAADKGLYNLAKIIVLALLYNMGPKSMSFKLKKDAGLNYSKYECMEFMQALFDGFPGIMKLKKRVEQAAQAKGYIRSYFGRHVFLPKIPGAERVALNTLIQSSASDFNCFAQLEVSKKLFHLGGRLVNIIHDETIYEVPESNAYEADRIVEETVRNFGRELRVPIETEGGVCKSWGSLKIPWNKQKA